jgi:hypothetical protein
MNRRERRILSFLRTRDRPTDVEKIRRSAGFSHWNAALTHLLQLYIDGKIDGQKTSKSWVFSAKRTQAHPNPPQERPGIKQVKTSGR